MKTIVSVSRAGEDMEVHDTILFNRHFICSEGVDALGYPKAFCGRVCISTSPTKGSTKITLQSPIIPYWSSATKVLFKGHVFEGLYWRLKDVLVGLGVTPDKKTHFYISLEVNK